METPINGQDFIGFKITTPGLDEIAIDYTEHVFVINQITSKVSTQPGVQVFSLSFCSPEGLRNYRIRASKSYTDSIDAIVEDLLISKFYINTKKTLFIEPTTGVRKIVTPNSPPFRIINELKKDAISLKYNSPHYMFYENIRGIHFRTLDSLYAQGTVADYHAGDRGSYDIAKKGAGNIDAEYKRTLDFQIAGASDVLKNTVSGMLASNLLTHDIYRKEYTYKYFDYFGDFYENYRINYDDGAKDNPVYSDTPIDEFDNTVSDFDDSRVHLHPTSTVINNSDAQYYNKKTKSYSYSANNIPKTILSRQSKLAELTGGMSILLEVYGTTTITVGSIINFSMPVSGAEHSDDKFDKYHSGKYLITAVRHMFDVPTKKHTCAISCVKDSISEELPLGDLSIEPKAEGSDLITEFYE
jgi:hypothetical protein